MATIADICTTFETLLVAGGPDYRTDVPYKLAAKHCPLSELPAAATWYDTTRALRVVPTVDVAEGHMNGWDVDSKQGVEIQVRYMLDTGAVNADETLQYMAACDARRVVNLLLRPNASTNQPVSGPEYFNVFYRSSQGPEPCDVAGIYLLTVTVDAVYLSTL